MRKLLLFLFVAILGMVANAQTSVSSQVDGSLTLSENSYVYFWGAATDTLIESDTITVILRARGSEVRNIGLGLYVTKVSGTVTNAFYVSYSMDGVTFTDTDTITLTNASTGLAGTVNIANSVYPYIRIQGIAGATAQKASYKLFAISRD